MVLIEFCGKGGRVNRKKDMQEGEIGVSGRRRRSRPKSPRPVLASDQRSGGKLFAAIIVVTLLIVALVLWMATDD
jgi:hypothetical protein